MMYLNSKLLSISKTEQYIHSEIDTILRAAKSKSVKLGIYEEQQYQSHQTMTPYLFGESLHDRTVDATVFFSILYYLDDYFGEDISGSEPLDVKLLFQAWTSGSYEAPSNSKVDQMYTALAYISNQLQQKSPPEYFERYTQYLLLHLQHSLHPEDYQSVEEYIQTRIHFGGMYPTIGMIEYVHNSYVSNELREQLPELSKLEEYCALIGALSNDLFSYHKEAHSRFNLLNAYRETLPNCSIEQAALFAIDKVNDLHASFRTDAAVIAQAIQSFEQETQIILNNYVSGLCQLIAASYHWQVNTSRYRSPKSIFVNMRTVEQRNMPL